MSAPSSWPVPLVDDAAGDGERGPEHPTGRIRWSPWARGPRGTSSILSGRDRQPGMRVLGDTWGGWVVVFGALMVIGYAALTALVDGRTVTTSGAGRPVLTTGGSIGSMVSYLFLLGMLVAGILGLITAKLRHRPVVATFATPMLMVLVWGVVAAAVRGGDTRWLTDLMMLCLLAAGVMASPPTWETLVRLNWIRDVTAVTGLLYNLAVPATHLECREDKCGILGGMWPGFFTNENTGGATVALLAPAMLVSGPVGFAVSATVSFLSVAASGSRTALIAYAVALAFVLMYRRRVRAAFQEPPALPWRLLPLGALVGSGILFLMPSSASFMTGRGLLYAEIKATFTGSLEIVVGSGPEALQDMMGGWIMSAHGEFPQLMVLYGAIGTMLALVGFASIAVSQRWTTGRTVAVGFLVAASARFLTEASFLLELRTLESVVLLVCMGLFAAPALAGVPSSATPAEPALADPEPASPSSLEPERAQQVPGE